MKAHKGFARNLACRADQYATDDDSIAVASGYESIAATSGSWSTAATSGGDSTAAASGFRSTATASGDRSTAATSGDRSTAVVTGQDSVAVAAGENCSASGAIGCWLMLVERDRIGRILDAKAVKVDGDEIKPGVLYTLRSGKVVTR